MRCFYSIVAIGITLSSLVCAGEPISLTTYDIAIQDDLGVEEQTLTIPNGGEIKLLKMAGGVVEIHPPVSSGEGALINLYVKKDGKLFLAHSAAITEREKIKVAYSLCNGVVGYLSPPPVHLAECSRSSDN